MTDVVASDANRRGLEFLTEGMTGLGWYELRKHRDRVGDFVRGRAVLSAVDGTYSYFGVLPRRRIGGSTKDDVIGQANLLWLDVDSPRALDYLGVFGELGLPPSVVIHSGRGYWWYWKLVELVPTDTVESLCHRLNLLARERVPDVDVACWNRNRCARLVGAVHEDGPVASVVEAASSWSNYEVSAFDGVLPELPKLPVVSMPVGHSKGHRAAVRSVYNRFRWYLEDATTDDVHANGQTRAVVEFALACALAEAGCSEDEALALFDEWEPLKHAERLRTARTNSHRYAEETIRNAFAAAPSHGSADGRDGDDEGEAVDGDERELRDYNKLDRYLVLRLAAESLDDGAPLILKKLCEEIVAVVGCVPKTVENAIDQLESSGYATREKNPYGRGKIVVPTEKGRKLMGQEGFQTGIHSLVPIRPSGSNVSRRRLLRRSSSPKQKLPLNVEEQAVEVDPSSSSASSELEAVALVERVEIDTSSCVSNAEHFGFQGSRYTRHAGWACSDSDLRLILKRNWIDDWYRISLLGGSATRLIQFTTGWDAIWERVKFYEQLSFGGDEYPTQWPGVTTGAPVYRSFVSQRDPNVAGWAAVDPISDRTWSKYGGGPLRLKPYKWTFGMAVELDRDHNPLTFEIVDADRTEKTIIRHGLVVERDWVFWEAVRDGCTEMGNPPLEQFVLEVKRSGKAGNHSFKVSAAGDAISFDAPNDGEVLVGVLEELASEGRLATYMNAVSDGYRILA